MANDMNVAKNDRARSADIEAVERTEDRPRYAPATDIYESDEGLILFMDVPGADEQSVEVHVENRVLAVTARVSPPEHGNRTLALQQYGVGDFYRSFTLNDEVDTEHIQAELRQGVLRILLPKAAQVRPRKIEVKGA